MAQCPCGSGRHERKCCGPILSGRREAATSEELVRARYTAFVRADIDFLVRTTHPTTSIRFDVEQNRQWAQSSEWLGLEIGTHTPGPNEDVEFIEFTATFLNRGLKRRHKEVSELRREDGKWYFYDGVPTPADPNV